MSYQQDASRSERAFETICAAPLKKFFMARKIISTAKHESELAALLNFSGVDCLVDSELFGLIPIQAKVSFGKPYRDFVVRRSRTNGAATDADKLARAEKYGTIKPICHCACFVDDDGTADVAVALTDDLLNFIATGLADVRAYDNGTFYTCDWQRLKDYGVKVFRLDCRADFQRKGKIV